jgi:ribosome-binding factor A
MSTEIRQRRVTGLLFEELSIMLAGELADPKLSLVTVTDVQVSKDLHNVRVFVNHQDDTVSKREVVARLQKATPFLRSQIAERLSLRVVPEITFGYDESPERAARLTEIFRQLAEERTQEAPDTPTQAGGVA